MLQDFKNFIMRGNVLDLAVAVIIGAAFNAVIQSLVDNVIMPIPAAILGEPDFSQVAQITLKEDAEAGDTIMALGAWMTDIINFLIIAASVFVFVKAAEKMQSRRGAAEVEEDAPAPSDEALILAEIRDTLRAQGSGQA